MSEFREKAFEGYAELRPRTFRPSSCGPFAKAIEPVFRKFCTPYLPASMDARILDDRPHSSAARLPLVLRDAEAARL